MSAKQESFEQVQSCSHNGKQKRLFVSSKHPLDGCYCLELRFFLGERSFRNQRDNHQERCVVCMNAIIEAKNELVRENQKLEKQLKKEK